MKDSPQNALLRAARKEINLDLPPNIAKAAFFALIGLVFAKMLVLNFLTPLIADDFGYASSTSVIDALQREYEQYMTWGGRSVVHFIARVFLMMPKGVFNIFNALIYTGLTLLIYFIAAPAKKINVILYLLICMSIWLFTRAYGQTVLWLTGSCNYLWGTFIILCFLLPYSFYASGKKTFGRFYGRKRFIVGMFFMGFLAGWCNENTSGGAVLAVMLIFLYCAIFREKIKAWMISGLAGGMTGFLFMILAPGNSVRSQHPLFLDERHISEILMSRINTYATVILTHFLPLIILFLAVIIAKAFIKIDWKRSYLSFMYFIVSIATVFAMVLSPSSNTGRTLFGAIIFMIIACAHCLSDLSLKMIPSKALSIYRVISASFIIFLAIQFAPSLAGGFADIRATKIASDEMHRYIESQIALGNLNLTVPHLPPIRTAHNAMSGLEGLTGDASHWVNASFAAAHGLESIIAE